jgi:hypothetical protein
LPTHIRGGGGGGFKDLIKQVSKRHDTTVANPYMKRRRRRTHQGFKDLIEQASIRLYTTIANAYTKRRWRRTQGLN